MVRNPKPGTHVRLLNGREETRTGEDEKVTGYWPAGCLLGTVVDTNRMHKLTLISVKPDHKDGIGVSYFQPSELVLEKP